MASAGEGRRGGWLEIDGSEGEGGGQILRTALSLSMCTGKPFRMVRVRALRAKPGLRRQHLTALRAAAEVSGAAVTGGEVGSLEISFAPGPVRGGEYRFDIGTAGSAGLVLQTLLPALLRAESPSRLVLRGGTHNPLAPCFHFLERAFLPLLRRMGAAVTLQLNRFGFFPAGGGEFEARIEPATGLVPLHLEARGELLRAFAESFVAALPPHIAYRELEVVRNSLGWDEPQLQFRPLANDRGPGNVLLLTLEHEQSAEVFAGFGEKGVPAEAVAGKAVAEARRYLASGAAVGPYLADQMLLPLALSGGGGLTASALSRHAVTNAAVIRRFLEVAFPMERLAGGAVRITVVPSASAAGLTAPG